MMGRKFTAPFGVWIYEQDKYVHKPIVYRILKLIAAIDNIMCHAKEKKKILAALALHCMFQLYTHLYHI